MPVRVAVRPYTTSLPLEPCTLPFTVLPLVRYISAVRHSLALMGPGRAIKYLNMGNRNSMKKDLNIIKRELRVKITLPLGLGLLYFIHL